MLATIFAPITKTERTADGFLQVYGLASGSQLDVDGQTCDPDWLKAAMPEWFQTGANIREMHQASAVGVGTELDELGGDHWLTAKIVDPLAITKTDTGVYQGFSIGIKSPKIVRDASAPNGRIVGGRIIEVSLVDRPSNGAARLILAKADGLDLVEVDQAVAVAAGTAGTNDDTDTAIADTEDHVAIARQHVAQWLASEAADVAAGTGAVYVVGIVAGLLQDLDLVSELSSRRLDEVSAEVQELAKSASVDNSPIGDHFSQLIHRGATDAPSASHRLAAELGKVALVVAAAAPTTRTRPTPDQLKIGQKHHQVDEARRLAGTLTDRGLAQAYSDRADELERQLAAESSSR